MKAAIFGGPRNLEVGERPDPAIKDPTDAVVRVTLACVCGSDLWYYRGLSPHDLGAIGHEFIGVVEDVGADVSGLKRGDLVIAPFVQAVVIPCRQFGQVPSLKANGAMTRSPRSGPVTSAPTSSTTPMNSWPIGPGANSESPR